MYRSQMFISWVFIGCGLCLQPVQRCGLLGPVVMYSTRKTWDVGHTPCLQELWNEDLSLDGKQCHMSGLQNRCSNIFLRIV